MKILTIDGAEEIECEPIRSPTGYEQVKMVSHKILLKPDAKGYPGGYTISEYTTGRSLGSGKTLVEACTAAIAKLNKHGLEFILETIRSLPVLNKEDE
jgi:hypothetical protein